MVVQVRGIDLAGEPASPLVLVEWRCEDGSRRVHTWSSYYELARAYWATHGEWVSADAVTSPPDNPASDLIEEIVSGAAHDATLVVSALIETAPSLDALDYLGASALEDLFRDDRIDDAAIAAMAVIAKQDSRWAHAAARMWIGDDASPSRSAVMADLGARRPGEPHPDAGSKG